ncbi:hypothetical protein RIF29_25290 [Crotalaria pallida]|uniref:Uncharacterized protein n=1 Tax=Crotalaria pallida TaxID=3830 RepID=A0AAN9ELV7_CROPI
MNNNETASECLKFLDKEEWCDICSNGSLSEKQKTSIFEVPISAMDDISAIQVSQDRSVLSDITNIIQSKGSLSKKRKKTLFEVPISAMNDIPVIDLSCSERANQKRRFEHQVDQQVKSKAGGTKNIQINNTTNFGRVLHIIPVSDNDFSSGSFGTSGTPRLPPVTEILPQIVQPVDNGFASGSLSTTRKRRVPQRS